MRSRFFLLSLASLLVSASWAGSVQAQTTTLYSSTIGISSYSAPNPRGTTYFNTNIPLSFSSGTTYTIQTAVATLPAYGIDTYIYLLNPSGVTVGSDDDNGLGLGNPYGSVLTYTAPTTGTYILVVTTYGSGSSYPAVPVTVTYPTPTTPPPTPTPTPTSGIPNVKLQLPKKNGGAQFALERLLGTPESNPSISAAPEMRIRSAVKTRNPLASVRTSHELLISQQS